MTNDKPKKQQKRFITMIVALRLYVLPNPWMNRFVSKMSSANTSILHISVYLRLLAFFHKNTTICYPKYVSLSLTLKNENTSNKKFGKIIIISIRYTYQKTHSWYNTGLYTLFLKYKTKLKKTFEGWSYLLFNTLMNLIK